MCRFIEGFLLTLHLLILIDEVLPRQVTDNFHWNRIPGNPGVKIRLTKKGINHLKTVGVKLLNEQIAGLKGHQTSFPLHQPAFEGFVQLNDFRVLQFHPAQVSVVNFLPPHEIVFGLENMDIWVASNFFATGGPIQVSGSADGSLIGMTVALTAQFASTIDGQMTVQVPNCSTIIGKSHFNINPQGPMGPLVKTLEGLINDGIRRKIPGLFCKKLKKLIEDNSPRLFARLTRTAFEEHFKSHNLTDNTVVKRFINDFVHGLYIDNRNIAHPSVTYDYFEMQMRGEIRYAENDNPTPFYPRPMLTNDDSSKMLYFYGSDYLFNSLLYHAYQTNKLTLELKRENLPKNFEGFVSTTCNAGGGDFASAICVGKLIPSIGQYYPNTNASFILLPYQLPDFRFNGDAGAIQLSTRLLTYVDVRGHKKQIMVASADGQADVHLHAQDGRFSGDLKLNRLAVHLHRSALPDMDPDSIEQLTPLAKTFIGPQLNDALKKGIPFPLTDSITFVDPALKQHEGFIELSTDFIINENALRAKIKQTFAGLEF